MSTLPGNKKLLLGPNDTRGMEFYSQYYTEIHPMHSFVPLPYQTGKHGEDCRPVNKQIMVSYVPAVGIIYNSEDKKKYLSTHLKFKGIFNTPKLNFILNIHSRTHGRVFQRHKAYDVSRTNNLKSLDQIMESVFHVVS